jgi:hypothetical protein
VGIVSSHSWLEDMAQATWLAWLLRRAGQPTLVGDVTDLATQRGRITLRGRPIDALYRFYPFERLYRHAIFASLCEASIDGRLLMLNGLRGFLAQSKACLAWLWANRSTLGGPPPEHRTSPAAFLARDPAATWLRRVVKASMAAKVTRSSSATPSMRLAGSRGSSRRLRGAARRYFAALKTPKSTTCGGSALCGRGTPASAPLPLAVS